MIRRVVARAHANIALIKYWGKQPGKLNVPATPSISLALDKLVTETTVTRIDSREDRFLLNSSPPDQPTCQRLTRYLDLWRDGGLLQGRFSVASVNYFPTRSGLASSASGFAALATALGRFTGGRLSLRDLSRYARIGSGSAARSVPGGIAAMPFGSDPAAYRLLQPDEVPWGMVIAVLEGEMKAIGSTEGMEHTRLTSPCYPAWTAQAKRDYREMLPAIKRRDFATVGRLTEANALAMHACMIASRPGLLYWSPRTVALLHLARTLREQGLESYPTVDAGHHVGFLASRKDLPDLARRIAKVDGVRETLTCNPAGGAEVVEWE